MILSVKRRTTPKVIAMSVALAFASGVATFSIYKAVTESKRANTAETELMELRNAIRREIVMHALEAHVYAGFDKTDFVPNCTLEQTVVSLEAKYNDGIDSDPIEKTIRTLSRGVKIVVPGCINGNNSVTPVSRIPLASAEGLLVFANDPEIEALVAKIGAEIRDGDPPSPKIPIPPKQPSDPIFDEGSSSIARRD